MMTLFQLFTLDQWYNIYQDVVKISDPVVTLLYILIWIGIGSFIFRNLFVGIMGMCWGGWYGRKDMLRFIGWVVWWEGHMYMGVCWGRV